MPFFRHCHLNLFLFILFINHIVMASSTMTNEELMGVEKTIIDSDELRQQLQKSAVLLANYEIEAKKLVRMANSGADQQSINSQASKLLDLSEVVIDSARFRLPQCDEYLAKSTALRDSLSDISHERLEQDYHHDGALPEAPAECYHAKDLFVHPASVLVLTRDDPGLTTDTRSSITAEITEVLAHTEFVRQLVLY
jgi:hypothetical protein